MAQLALYEPETVDLPQVFLLFVTDAKGQTLYERIAAGKLVFGDGKETQENPDLQGPRSGSLPQDTHKRRQVAQEKKSRTLQLINYIKYFPRIASESPHCAGSVCFLLPLPIAFFNCKLQ
jgi:hypothetical protein